MIRFIFRFIEKILKRPYVWVEDESHVVWRLRVTVTPFGATINRPQRSGRSKLLENGTVNLTDYGAAGKWKPANKYAKNLFEVKS